MKLIELFIPLYDNEGEKFSDEHFENLKSELTDAFGGVTIYKKTSGYWKEPERPVKKDEILIYEIMAEQIKKAYWQALKRRLLILFRQKDLVFRYSDIEML